MLDALTVQQKIQLAWPQHTPKPLSSEACEKARARIKRLLHEKDAVIVSHYYVDHEIQRLADETGGVVADSLEMARFGARHPAKTLVVAGVRFMGETAKILSPEKTVLMPSLQAECSLDLSCDPVAFKAFCSEHPDRTVVVYANTSAAVKACADWVVTSSIALDIVRHLDDQEEKLLWAPDRYLGQWIQTQTGADMLCWEGACVVHEEFKANALKALKVAYPDAAVLVHPESPAAVVQLADVVGSTSQLLKASQTLPNPQFIVATDNGILYKMRLMSPKKQFIEAPTGGDGATCRSCAHCPWMAMNGLENLADALETGSNVITIPEDFRLRALQPLQRMVDFIKS